jgi:CubicO group peptidase (beta-lactamase class C family)
MLRLGSFLKASRLFKRGGYSGAVLALVVCLFAPILARADSTATTIQNVARAAMAANHLRAVIVEVRSDGNIVYTGAFGDSMTGVPATPDMHFRGGAIAFTYMATLLLEFVDRRQTTLDTKLSKYFPNLPDADRITLRNLAQMTSGYADYVYQPEVIRGTYRDPFRNWSSDELIRIGVSKPIEFAPGTNWGYSHTNYVILGRVLEKIAGVGLADAIRQNVLLPAGLAQTQAGSTASIPEPALHTFSSERREVLGIPPATPFYEEATFWNPSWTTVDGAIETTDINDLALSIEAVASGKLLTKESSATQISSGLVGFGHAQSGCPACRTNDNSFNYGLGVIRSGAWIAQTLGFAGASGAVGYLPSHKLTIAVEATNAQSAYGAKGDAGSGASAVFRALADALAPGTFLGR